MVTEADWLLGYHDDLRGMIYFDDDNPFTWYQVKPRLIEAALTHMGFGDFVTERHTQKLLQDVTHSAESGPSARQWNTDVAHFTVTAKRIAQPHAGGPR